MFHKLGLIALDFFFWLGKKKNREKKYSDTTETSVFGHGQNKCFEMRTQISIFQNGHLLETPAQRKK